MSAFGFRFAEVVHGRHGERPQAVMHYQRATRAATPPPDRPPHSSGLVLAGAEDAAGTRQRRGMGPLVHGIVVA